MAAQSGVRWLKQLKQAKSYPCLRQASLTTIPQEARAGPPRRAGFGMTT